MRTLTMKPSLKKLFALVMCMIVSICMFSVNVSAIDNDQDIDVTFWKSSDPTELSMANDAVAGTAFYDYSEETLTIPLRVVEKTYLGITHYGYIDEIGVDTDGNTGNGYEVTAYPDSTPYPSGGSITISLDSSLISDDCDFDVSFGIDLYYDQAGTIPAIYSHVDAEAIMNLVYAD